MGMMRELDLLEHIYASRATAPSPVTIGPGDDAASLQLAGPEVLVTVDQVADGIHVDLTSTPLEKVARKAVTRSLSDVAAMAAKPTAAVVAASLPRRFGTDLARRLFDAMSAVAQSYHCPLVGGDISIWDHPLLLTVTVLAEPVGIRPVTRRGAQVGDCVCVTGDLGGSRVTLDGYTHHLDFEPRLDIARRLAADPDLSLHCMIDLSDGLAIDLARLCHERAGPSLAAEIWADRLPISAAAYRASRQDGAPAWHHALGDGEDYELCFTIPPLAAESALPRDVGGVSVTQVGVVTARDAGPTVVVKMPDGTVESADHLGWEHR